MRLCDAATAAIVETAFRQLRMLLSQWQTPQQRKDQQNEQDQPNYAAARAENGVPALEAVATAQQ
jgi:hypothetical protein